MSGAMLTNRRFFARGIFSQRRTNHSRAPRRAPSAVENDGAKGDPSPSADELVSQLLASDPEAQERVASAAKFVAELQMEQARLARAIADAQSASDEGEQARQQRAAEAARRALAEAEVKAAELRLRAAELEAEAVESQRAAWAAQTEQEADRLESGKAATAAAAGGVAASLPFVATTSASPVGGLISLAGIAASAFLFGVVYRYAVRRDLANTQLKAGVVGAFGLVRGIAQASEVVSAGSANLTVLPSAETLGMAAAAMGESMLTFGFASAALEFAFRQRLVKPLGSSDTGES